MNRFAYPIFCDDMRNEVNGKFSLMGVFGGLMYLPGFPAVLPKLCAVITVVSPLSQPFSTITFTGSLDGNVVFEITIGEEQLGQMGSGGTVLDDPKYFEARAMVVLSPLHISAPGKLDVTILADGEKVECTGLQISHAPEGMVIV